MWRGSTKEEQNIVCPLRHANNFEMNPLFFKVNDDGNGNDFRLSGKVDTTVSCIAHCGCVQRVLRTSLAVTMACV